MPQPKTLDERYGEIHIVLRARNAAFNVSRTNPDDSVARNEYKASRYERRKSIRWKKNTTLTCDACVKDYKLSRSAGDQGLQAFKDYR